MPICKARYIGAPISESADYTGPVVVLEVEIPVDQVSNLNSNEANRREVASILAAASGQAPRPPQPPITPLKGMAGG